MARAQSDFEHRRPAHAEDGASSEGQPMSRPLASLGGLYSESACRTSLKIAFEKGPGADERRAKGMGSCRAELAARQMKGAVMRRSAASYRRQQNFVGSTNFAPIDEQEAAKSFAAAVIDFDAATLARAARRHVETAKLWKAGRRCPNTSSTINMASIIPAVQGWLDGEVESRKPKAPVDSRAATAALARLQQEAMQPGERGAMARSILADLSGGT